MNTSRRGLFGLLAVAAVAPTIVKAAPPVATEHPDSFTGKITHYVDDAGSIWMVGSGSGTLHEWQTD